MNRDQLLLNNRARRLGGKIEQNPELPAPRTKARTSASALLSVFLMVSMSLEDDDGGYDDGSDYRVGGEMERDGERIMYASQVPGLSRRLFFADGREMPRECRWFCCMF